jgi:[ribosomal protein S5]-alanine N-acetyltransferase
MTAALDLIDAPPKLTLRPVRNHDVFWLSTLIMMPTVRALMLGVRSGGFSEASEMVQSSLYLNQHRPGLGFWIALDQKQRMVGVFSLIPQEHERIEMGVQLHPDFWGQWHGVAGGKILASHAFDHLKLNEVFAYTHPTNLAAQAIARRVGFVVEEPLQTYNGFSARVLRFDKLRYQSLNWPKTRNAPIRL